MATKIVRYVSPKGIAMYPWVITADTAFVKEGVYHIQLECSQDDPKTTELVEKLTVILDKEHETLSKEKNKKLNKIPFFDESEDGKHLVFKFKQNKIIKRKDGTTSEVKIPLFDAKGKPITESIKLGNGSVCRVSFTVAPYFNATNKGVGLSLRLVAVQVIDLVEYSAGNAESYGFDEEEGYEAKDADEDPPFEESYGSSEDANNGDY